MHRNTVVPVNDDNASTDSSISVAPSPLPSPRMIPIHDHHTAAVAQISKNVELLRQRLKISMQLFKNIHVEQRAVSLQRINSFNSENLGIKRADSMSSLSDKQDEGSDTASEGSVVVNSQPLQNNSNNQKQETADVENEEQKIFTWQNFLSLVHDYLTPGSRIGNTWLVFILLLTMYNILLVPFRIAFVPYSVPTTIVFAIIDFIVDIFLFVDMLFQLLMPFQSRDGLEKETKKTALNYLRSWFLVDMISLLPIDLALIIPFPQYVPFFRLNRLVRMLRYFRYWRTVEDYSNFSTSAIRIPQFVILCFILTHWFSCGFALILQGEGPILTHVYLGVDVQSKNFFLQYVYSLYVVLSSMVGYGGSVPITLPQFIYAEFITLFGVLVIILLFGVVGSLISSSGENEAKQKKKLDDVKEYLTYRKVPKQTREKIINYYDFMSRSRKGWDEQKILHELPSFLRVEVAMDINRKLIEKVPLFNVEGVNKMFIASVVVRLIPRVCLPNTIIVEQGELGREMFFISSGYVEVVSNDGKIIYKTLYEGSFFGEIALIYDTRRNATVRAGTFCELYILTKDAFDEIAIDYPEQVEAIKKEAQKRMAEQKK